MAISQKTKDRIQTIALIVLGLFVVYAVATGQISLSALFGGGTDTPQGGTDPAVVDPTNGGENGGGTVDPNGGNGGTTPASTVRDGYGNKLDAAGEHVTLDDITVYRDGWYYSKDEVALYIYTWGELPDNYLTKSAAKALGWTGGSLEKYKEGAVIGGSNFGNNEGLLPKAKGRVWTECDIDTLGESSRGALRIVFSNDGLIYYTDDHYESYTLLYDKDGKQY